MYLELWLHTTDYQVVLKCLQWNYFLQFKRLDVLTSNHSVLSLFYYNMWLAVFIRTYVMYVTVLELHWWHLCHFKCTAMVFLLVCLFVFQPQSLIKQKSKILRSCASQFSHFTIATKVLHTPYSKRVIYSVTTMHSCLATIAKQFHQESSTLYFFLWKLITLFSRGAAFLYSL